ncbi:hypothetical protein DESA109040_02885 [Deinococcus saxicola]
MAGGFFVAPFWVSSKEGELSPPPPRGGERKTLAYDNKFPFSHEHEDYFCCAVACRTRREASRLIRVPSISCRNRDSADSCTPCPEPVFLLLTSFGFPGVSNTFQSEFVSYGFRLFCAGIGTAPIPPLHVRNPFFFFSLRSDFQVFPTPFNRSPYQPFGGVWWKIGVGRQHQPHTVIQITEQQGQQFQRQIRPGSHPRTYLPDCVPGKLANFLQRQGGMSGHSHLKAGIGMGQRVTP